MRQIGDDEKGMTTEEWIDRTVGGPPPELQWQELAEGEPHFITKCGSYQVVTDAVFWFAYYGDEAAGKQQGAKRAEVRLCEPVPGVMVWDTPEEAQAICLAHYKAGLKERKLYELPGPCPTRRGQPPKFGVNSPPVEVVRGLLEALAAPLRSGYTACADPNCEGALDDMADCDPDCRHKAAVEWLAARDHEIAELEEAMAQPRKTNNLC